MNNTKEYRDEKDNEVENEAMEEITAIAHQKHHPRTQRELSGSV